MVLAAERRLKSSSALVPAQVDVLVTWQLASPRAQDSKEMKKQSFYDPVLGRTVISALFYNHEKGVTESCSHSREKN